MQINVTEHFTFYHGANPKTPEAYRRTMYGPGVHPVTEEVAAHAIANKWAVPFGRKIVTPDGNFDSGFHRNRNS